MGNSEKFPLVDSRGKRYRLIGTGCIEYEPEIVTSFGTFAQSNYVHPEKVSIPIPKARKMCPFKISHYTQCTEDCSFFMNDACCPGKAQTGKRCPLPGRIKCGEGCMLYDNGRCALFNNRKETEDEQV